MVSLLHIIFTANWEGNILSLEIKLNLEVNAWLESQVKLIPLPPQEHDTLEKPVEYPDEWHTLLWLV